MFEWIATCLGGVNNISEFERARLACTYADWTVPDQKSLNLLIETFRGENTQTEPEIALNKLFFHLEQDQSRKNAAFLLKHLLILDLITEERIFLNRISHYNNNQFLYLETGNQIISSSIKDLLSHYYKYIRNKAKLYQSQAIQLVKRQSREKYIQKSNHVILLNQINICFKIQNEILTVSDGFANGNKSPQIIQMLFSSLLKTYLFCFSIVSLAMKNFIDRVSSMKKHDLQYVCKLANFFNRDYTKNLILFIEKNKVIDNFRTLKYNQLIILNDRIIEILTAKLKEAQEDTADFPQLSTLPLAIQETIVIENMPESPDRESEVVSRVRRKNIENKNLIGEEEPESCFKEYKNFYQDQFIIPDGSQTEERSIYEALGLKKSSQSEKKKLYTKLSFSKDLSAPDLKKQFSLEENKKFQKQIWENWQNIYCT